MKKFQVDMNVCVGFGAFECPYEHLSLGMAVEALNAYDAAVMAYKRAVRDFGGRRVAVHFVKIEEVETDAEESE